MMRNRVNLLADRLVFLEEVQSGPEAGGDLKELFECSCEVYEPTLKDTNTLNIKSNKQIVTVTVRDARPSFKPKPHHQFKLISGYFKGRVFNIKSIVPYSNDPSFLKIVGEGV